MCAVGHIAKIGARAAGPGSVTLLPSTGPFSLLASGLDLLSELIQAPNSNLHPVPIVPTCLSPLEPHLEFQTWILPISSMSPLGVLPEPPKLCTSKSPSLSAH